MLTVSTSTMNDPLKLVQDCKPEMTYLVVIHTKLVYTIIWINNLIERYK